jgi:hypothetical protein
MTKTFCDRCDAETTGQQSGCLTGVDDADTDGGGTVTHTVELCGDCYQAWIAWAYPSHAPAPPASVAASDPHVDSTGNPGTRENLHLESAD